MKKVRFCILHKPMGGARAPPALPLATLLIACHIYILLIYCSSVIRHYNKTFNKNHESESESSQISRVRVWVRVSRARVRVRVRVLKKWPRFRLESGLESSQHWVYLWSNGIKLAFFPKNYGKSPPLMAEVESSRTSLASRTHFEVLGLGLEASSPQKLACPRLEDCIIFWMVKIL